MNERDPFPARWLRPAAWLARLLAIALVYVPGAVFARGASVPLTVTPSALAFSIPLAPATLVATVQYTGLITAAAQGGCASVQPASVPAAKPQGSSVYVAKFTVTPLEAAQPCTIVVTDKKGNQVRVRTEVKLDPSHLHFVAHEDDDLLFMNPDIRDEIDAGHFVTTVYLTSGTCPHPDAVPFALAREAGVMEAYARMAGVANEWFVADQPVREVRLAARPKVALVFLRLSASKSEAGGVCDGASTNLSGLWNGGAGPSPLTMTAFDGTNTYTSEQLVSALAKLMQRFRPIRIGTLDSTGLFSDGTDPSGLQISYEATERCYFYDHSDHYYSAVFAGAARASYRDAHEYRRYRGYNQADEAVNLSIADILKKTDAFAAYGEHDASVGEPPGFSGLYGPWVQRQYEASAAPAPFQPLCQLLEFAQQPSVSAQSGVPLAQQPVLQLRALSGDVLAIAGVEVEAILVRPENSSATLAGTQKVTTDASGRAVFADLAIVGPPLQYPLAFIASGYAEIVSEPVDVVAP